MSRSRIYLVEDHPLMRATLSEYLATAPDLRLCGTAATGELALEALASDPPDLLLVDVSLPGMSGLELVENVVQRWPGVACVILSGHPQPAHVERALQAGARGYILKGNPYEIPEAIRHVLDGGTYLSEGLGPR
jgi:DNA-binding NarL/FixJ family response regulator